jgi:hypothetical protein
MQACFRAERIKIRKSWMLLTAILAPLCQAGFLAVIFWFSDSRVRMFRPGYRFWLELNYATWAVVFMPIVAGLLAELSWEQEREARAWNHLLLQPFPRRTHYLVKALGHFALLALSQVLLLLGLLLLGRMLQSNRDLLMGPLPYGILTRFAGYSLLASIPVVTFHTWLSMRVPGLWISLAMAMGGSWLCVRLAGSTPWLQFLPWGLSAQLPTMFERWHVLPWKYLPGACLLACGLVFLGALDFARHRESGS